MPYVYSGLLDLPWWGHVLAALGLTHVTIISVTVYLHRHQAHRALELHPIASHFFRFWLWLTTGMVTKEWTAVHRKHHARCETAEDPHSPQVHGIWKVLFAGVFLYVKESANKETLARFGEGTPDDWAEYVYAANPVVGFHLMGLIDIALFGLVPGMLILTVQIVWIPFWAAGVINGVGHYWGRQNFKQGEKYPNVFKSKNIVEKWGVFIGGEEFHNNHHAYPASAKFSKLAGEFDIAGDWYIPFLERFGLASRVKYI